MNAPNSPKFPAALALEVAKSLCQILKLACVDNPAEGRPYLVCAGSLRRKRREVGDLELVYVAKRAMIQDGLFPKDVDLVDTALDILIEEGVLKKRLTAKGQAMWGGKNKLAVHVATGLPVDFFATTPTAWFNYLVCRTGGAKNNTLIASQAKERGLTWNPYENGFSVRRADPLRALMKREKITLTRGNLCPDDISIGRTITVESEQDVFALAGLPYQQPHERA